MRLVARHSQQMHDLESEVRGLKAELENARTSLEEESAARQAGDDLNAELLEKLEARWERCQARQRQRRAQGGRQRQERCQAEA